MKFLSQIVAHKLFASALLVGVGLWFLVIPIFADGLGANPVERLLHQSGEIAIWTLGAVLALSPLRVLFPRSGLVNGLNRHRRMIGVTACVYGLLHFSLHVLYEGGWHGLVQSFSKPFIWLGLAGLTILVMLAATSNQFSIRALGGRNWKWLHRLAYLAAGLLIYHQAIAGKGHWRIARWLLLSLGLLQGARLAKIAFTKWSLNLAGSDRNPPARSPAAVTSRKILSAGTQGKPSVTQPMISRSRSEDRGFTVTAALGTQ